MAGYYTVKRKLKPLSLGGAIRNPPFTAGVVYLDLGSPANGLFSDSTQQTTSWRTGRGYPTVEDVQSEIDTPSTEAGVFQYLRKLDNAADFNVYRPYDTGHTFQTTQKYIEGLTQPHIFGSSSGGAISYEGPLVPRSLSSGNAAWWDVGAFTSGRYGPSAIAATAPVNPTSTFGTGFYDSIIGGWPHLIGEQLAKQASILRKAGKEFLNLEFGWSPFVSDLRSSLGSALAVSNLLQQYQRDSGRVVRRYFRFPVEHTVLEDKTSPTGGVLQPSAISGANWFSMLNVGAATTRDVVFQERQIWFKGAYSYFLDAGSDPISRVGQYVDQAQHLLGLEWTPELLWQVSPWSWLVDWHTQIGNSIKNASLFATDGLVIRWGYLMCHTILKHNITVNGLTFSGRPIASTAVTFVTEDKQRVKASPYGFGVDSSGFSNFQWSILAALGLTKAPRSLW